MNNSGIIEEYNYYRGKKIKWYNYFISNYISDKLGNVIIHYKDLLDDKLLANYWIKIKELESPVFPQIKININPMPSIPKITNIKSRFNDKESLDEFEIIDIIENNDADRLSNFINKGFDINGEFKHSLSGVPLSYAVAHNSSLEIINILINAGADVNLNLGIYYSNVLTAVRNNNIEILQVLLSNGAKVDDTDVFRRTALIIAIENGNMPIIEILLSYSANINHTQHHLSPLMKAIEKDNINIIKYLLQNGADVNLKTNFGGTALQYAIDNEKSEIILLLKNAGTTE
jgi:ankyrin repeat protein